MNLASVDWRKCGFVLCFLPTLICCQRAPSTHELFEDGRVCGTNKNELLEEVSGIVASAANPGYLWALNDSGHPAQLFLLDSNARTKKVFFLAHVRNRDWEDLTLDILDGKATIYVGDIGDNSAKHTFKYIYRIQEPTLLDQDTVVNVDTLVVRLSDDIRDTETLFCDPVTHHLYLVSKREKEVGLYELKFPFTSDTLVAQKLFLLPLREIVSGAVSPSGDEVLLKSYRFIYYWKKKGSETIPELLLTEPVKLPYSIEPMGESITWARDASGYYTLGENARGERAKLFFYKRK